MVSPMFSAVFNECKLFFVACADGQKYFQKTEGEGPVFMCSATVPASTYGLETLALPELHQHKLQVCENVWIRRIASVKRVERRRMKHLREEIGTKACIVGKIVTSRMKWAGQNQNRFIRSYYRPRRPLLRPIWSLSQRKHGQNERQQSTEKI